MLWNIETGMPTVVSVLHERDDRWVGQRCQVAMTSFEAPIEVFMKSAWRRDLSPQEETAAEPSPASAGPAFSLKAFAGGSTP
jgi:hypothetical protein